MHAVTSSGTDLSRVTVRFYKGAPSEICGNPLTQPRLDSTRLLSHYLRVARMNMLLLTLLSLSGLGAATCTTSINVWIVQRNDTVDEAARVLGLQDYQAILDLNPGINTAFVSPGDTYSVPYTNSLSSPGSWSTSTSCTKVLHLWNALTQSSGTAIISVGGASACKPTTDSLGSRTGANLGPSGTKPDSYATTTVLIEDQVGSISQSEPSPVNPSSITSTSASVVTSETQSRSPATSTVSVERCHGNGAFLTVNNTQSSFAKSFCKNHGQTAMTPRSDIAVELFDGGDKHFYFYSVDWVEGCRKSETQEIDSGGTCVDIMTSNYEQCQSPGQLNVLVTDYIIRRHHERGHGWL